MFMAGSRGAKPRWSNQDSDPKETARKNGALVGGSSAPGGGTVPVYKSGSARNAGEAMRVMGII